MTEENTINENNIENTDASDAVEKSENDNPTTDTNDKKSLAAQIYNAWKKNN